MAATKAQVICAPSREQIRNRHTIFLAGTTTKPEWREGLLTSLSHEQFTIFNPLRRDWDDSWREDETFEPFREQVQWELDMQDRSDLVIVYFGPNTDAPISLLELGLCARLKKALVVCHPNYRKKGNVQLICRRYGIKMLASFDGLAEAIKDKLAAGSEFSV